jgi:hypothetical protein
MKQPTITRRRFVHGTLAVSTTTTLAACGGGGEEELVDVAAEEGRATTASASGATRSAQPAPGPSKAADVAPAPAPAPAPSPAPAAGTPVTSLRLSAQSVGTVPYSASVLPRPGQVPQGSTLVSPDDGSLRASIISRYADGSAAVMVVAGTANITSTGDHNVRLQLGSPVAGEAPLTPARIGQLVNNVRISFGDLGVVNLTSFANPEHVWWSNAQTICARYRAPVPGHQTLEVLVDIQAWAGQRALVEVVVENARLNPGAPAKPQPASYQAVVTINGNSAGSVSSAGAPEGNHAAFRAWYTSAWVGPDPRLSAVQAHTDLQQHPLLFKCDRGGTDMGVYASDGYTAWAPGRHRGTNMGAAGDHPSIGPLPQWEARFLQTGDRRAARAVEVNTLAVLGFNVNYRDGNTGLVPNFSQVQGRSMQSNWPVTYGPSDAMTWKVSHHPAAGLMAFAVRPSPIFIEIAQKIALWNGTWSTWGGTPTGVFGRAYQMRGRAWGLRSLAHAVLLSPDAMPWKAAGQTSITANVNHLALYSTDSKAKLNSFWEALPTLAESTFPWINGFGNPMWQHHYLVTELHKLASARLLSGATQTSLSNLADWAAMQPVRWVNEQANGGWRYIPYGSVIGRNASTIDSLPNWAEQQAWWMTDQPPAVAGTWMSTETVSHNQYAQYGSNASAGAYYPSYFWAALVAAVDRNLPGATQAWGTVLSNVTNLESWRNGFANDPRWGSTPLRDTGFAVTPIAAPTPAPQPVAADTWVPQRDLAGNVTQASWESVPRGRWLKVAGTQLNQLDAAVKAAIPGWRDWGVEGWKGVTDAWNGMAIDTAGSRLWLKGGGHAASSNNGIYRFDALKMAWAIENLPSDPTPWSESYKRTGVLGGSFTYCTEANAQMEARQTAGTLQPVNDAFYDELPWDGKPTSRHTYSGLVFVPDTNELVMICRRLWRYSITDRRWTYKRLIRDQVAIWLDGENMVSIYDEARREVLVSSYGSSGLWRATGYDLTGNRWTDWGSPWVTSATVADTRVGRRIICVEPPARQTIYSPRPGRYWEYDLDTRSTVRSGNLQYAAGLARDDFAPDNWFYDSASLTYVPTLNRYWFFTMMAQGGMALLEVDPTTTPWTVRRMPAEMAVPTIGRNLERKMVYLPALNAVLLCDTADKEMWLYKC